MSEIPHSAQPLWDLEQPIITGGVNDNDEIEGAHLVVNNSK